MFDRAAVPYVVVAECVVDAGRWRGSAERNAYIINARPAAAWSPERGAMFAFIRRRRYAVAGVKPRRSRNGHDDFDGEMLAATPPVMAALARAPRVFLAIVGADEDDLHDGTIPGSELCLYLEMRTRDGITWGLGFEDAVKVVVDTGDGLLERALAHQPDVVEAVQEDREVFAAWLARPLPADEMLARFIDALSAAHREQAQRGGIALPR